MQPFCWTHPSLRDGTKSSHTQGRGPQRASIWGAGGIGTCVTMLRAQPVQAWEHGYTGTRDGRSSSVERRNGNVDGNSNSVMVPFVSQFKCTQYFCKDYFQEIELWEEHTAFTSRAPSETESHDKVCPHRTHTCHLVEMVLVSFFILSFLWTGCQYHGCKGSCLERWGFRQAELPRARGRPVPGEI